MKLQSIQNLTRKLWSNASNKTNDDAMQLTPALQKVVNVAHFAPKLTRFSPNMFRKILWCMEQPFNQDKVDMTKVKEYQVKVNTQVNLADTDSITLRAYYPHGVAENEPSSALVYYHGGGLVIGSIDTHDLFCRLVAEQSQQVVISVDYRLAPEYKFPTPVEDSICAWNWVCDNAEQLNIDIHRTGVGGDSAGGFIATSVVLQYLQPSLHNQPQIRPAFQWLIYPMMDMRCNSESYQRCSSGMLLTNEMMLYFRDHFVKHINQVHTREVSPILTESFAGIPPTFIMTVQHDPLMDDGVEYANIIKKQGDEVIHHHHTNLLHGFISYGGVCPTSKKAVQQAIDSLVELIPEQAPADNNRAFA